MKKKIFREKYYKGIEHDGTNFGKRKVIENQTKSIEFKLQKKLKKGDK